MACRPVILATDEIYHVFNRGVEDKIIFQDKRDNERFIKTFWYYQKKGVPTRFSFKNDLSSEKFASLENLVEIIAYTLMPTHFHFLLKQKKEGGITTFIRKLLDSYTRYFNVRYKRLGHLFQGPFKAVRIEDDNQLMHVSRYIHLNPLVDCLTLDLRKYPYSSYSEYLGLENDECQKEIVLSQFPSVHAYEKFVLDREDYARRLNAIKRLTLEINEA